MTPEVERWDSEIERDENDDGYQRSASGRLEIEGDHGTITVLARYRAMLDADNDLMEAGEISETLTYFHKNQDRDAGPFWDGKTSWDVPADLLEDWQAFIEECEQSLLADPEVTYELAVENLPSRPAPPEVEA